MRSYIAVSIFAFSASVLSAPTPQLGLNGVVDSVTGTAGNTVGSLAGTAGKTTDPVTGLLKEKRQLQAVGGLLKPATDLVGDVTKTRVLGNARRQLQLAPVSELTKTVDSVTDSVNLAHTVDGVNTNVHSKRNSVDADAATGLDTNQLTAHVAVGDLLNIKAALSAATGLSADVTVGDLLSVDVDLNNNGLTADVSAGDLLNIKAALSAADGLSADVTVGDLLNLNLDVNKRQLPVVQDLPVLGAVSSLAENTPLVGGVTDTVAKLTGDLDPVTELVYDAAQPVTEATNLLDVRAPILDEVESLVGGVSNIGNHNAIANGVANNAFSGDSINL